MLARGGVKRIDVVTGFMTDMVEDHLRTIADPRVEVNVRFNPAGFAGHCRTRPGRQRLADCRDGGRQGRL